MKDTPTLRPNVLLTRYPIVFIHGLKSLFNFRNYWNGIPEHLIAHGYDVYVLKTHWRGPQSKRLNKIKCQISEILKEHKKIHIFAHSMGALDTLKLLDDAVFAPHITSATFISPPFKGSPWADVLARFTPGMHQELTKIEAQKALSEFKNISEAHLTTITAEPQTAPISPLLKAQHFLLTNYLKASKQAENNDGLVPVDSQRAAIGICGRHACFPGDHHQTIGSGPWPKNLKPARELYLDHSIFLAERDLQASE